MTKRERQILVLLSDGRRHTRADIKSSFNFMQQMYFNGWVDGAALPDRNGFGNFPETSLWQITNAGRIALAAKDQKS